MPCNLVNFISVNRELEVGRGRQQGEDTRKKERSKVEKTPAGKEKKCRGGGDWLPPPRTRRCPAMPGRLSLCAGVEAPARAEPSSEAARRRARESSEEHVLPFYRAICPCAEHVCVRAVRAIRAACLDKSSLAGPCATLCASAFLQVVVVVFFGGQEEATMAMSRQNQLVAVFYSSTNFSFHFLRSVR